VSRHKSRQQALELLYSREFHKENDIQYKETEILEQDSLTAEDLTADTDEITDQDEQAYCQYLLDTVSDHKAELDTVIQTYAKDWNVDNMNHTDRNILRLALCELMYPKEPMASSIVLNEAIILAKEFSGQKAARFVNGILGAYVKAQP
jgi:N utilization substance protein B